eukprot:4660747-Amphidinium_carterae.2
MASPLLFFTARICSPLLADLPSTFFQPFVLGILVFKCQFLHCDVLDIRQDHFSKVGKCTVVLDTPSLLRIGQPITVDQISID